MPYLRTRNISVEFPIYRGSSRSLKRALLAHSTRGNLARDAFDRIMVRALQDVSFDIDDGERVALIGANGAGKSTLLKVLGSILEPASGRLLSSGHVFALLDSAVGLEAHATGRENILLRGIYLGINPREMRKHVDDIVDFTELGNYIDMPVRTYSTGMMIRLAFAISTCVPTDILLMDEWLGAGDAHFLAKAQQRMANYVRSSSILVLASQSMPLIEQWCGRGILLEQGRIVAMGPIGDVTAAYAARERQRDLGPSEARVLG
jgi:ABC-type polysaccharide/polyol phosphate transport system ATPase subunit